MNASLQHDSARTVPDFGGNVVPLFKNIPPLYRVIQHPEWEPEDHGYLPLVDEETHFLVVEEQAFYAFATKNGMDLERAADFIRHATVKPTLH